MKKHHRRRNKNGQKTLLLCGCSKQNSKKKTEKMKKLTQKYSKRKYKNIFIGQGATPGCNRLPVKIRKNLPSEYGYLSEATRQTGRYIEHLPGRIGNTYKIRSQAMEQKEPRSQAREQKENP